MCGELIYHSFISEKNGDFKYRVVEQEGNTLNIRFYYFDLAKISCTVSMTVSSRKASMSLRILQADIFFSSVTTSVHYHVIK